MQVLQYLCNCGVYQGSVMLGCLLHIGSEPIQKQTAAFFSLTSSREAAIAAFY